jgi:hypothetical protein
VNDLLHKQDDSDSRRLLCQVLAKPTIAESVAVLLPSPPSPLPEWEPRYGNAAQFVLLLRALRPQFFAAAVDALVRRECCKEAEAVAGWSLLDAYRDTNPVRVTDMGQVTWLQ